MLWSLVHHSSRLIFRELGPIRVSSLVVRLLSGGRPGSSVVLIKSMKLLLLVSDALMDVYVFRQYVHVCTDQTVGNDHSTHTSTNSNVHPDT